jgi:hypothetical protein
VGSAMENVLRGSIVSKKLEDGYHKMKKNQEKEAEAEK